MCEKFWMVVDVLWAADWIAGDNEGMRVPRSAAPRFMHFEKKQAEKELLRLQQENPDHEFVLLEAVSFVKMSPVDPEVFFVEEI